MRWLLCILLLASASAQIVVDPAGDVIIGSQGQTTGAVYPWQAVDFTAISMEETESSFFWTISIAGEATNALVSCPDTGDLRTFFRYGEARYHVQQGLDLNCNPYAMLWETFSGDFNRRFISTLNVEIVGTDITAEIPKELILDDGGSPPMEGRFLTHIRGRSFNMASLGGPDLNDPSQEGDLLVVNDDIPDAGMEGGIYAIQSGGIRYEGEARLLSDRPFRASNGGAGVYVYEVTLENNGASDAFALSYLNIPDQWRIGGPSTTTIPAGETKTLEVAVEVPFRHIHGGSDAFVLRAEGNTSWAEIDLGVSYLAVPQPAGHHPQVFFHHTTTNGFPPLLGGSGAFFMNTTEPMAQQFSSAAYADGPTGSTAAWYICLDEDLKLGLNFTEDLGSFQASFQTGIPGEGSIEGTLYHLGPGIPLQGCHPSYFGNREQTALASFAPQSLTVPGTLDAPMEASAGLVSYEAGATLFMEVRYSHDAPNVVQLGNLAMGGASMTLPLAEYREGAVIGAIGETDGSTSDVEAFNDPAPEEEKDTPALLPLLGLLLLALLRRR